MVLGHEYHSKDNTPSIYVAPTSDNGSALQLTGISLVDANALCIAIVDGNGDQIVSFGGGQQYTDGGAGVTHPIGTAIIFQGAANAPTVVSATNPLPVTGTFTLSNYALETGGNLATIVTNTNKIPSLGQALAAASVPVVLTAAQITTLTPPSNSGYALDATLTGGTQQTKITDGTNLVGVLKNDGTVGSQNSLLTAGSSLEYSFTTTSAQAVATKDASNYRSISVHIVQQGTNSNVTFQGSNDNSNWVTVELFSTSQVQNSSSGNTSSTGIFFGQICYRYFRLNITGITAGTTSGVIELFALPIAAQPTMGVNLAAVGQNGFPSLADNADAIAVSATANKLPVINRATIFNGTSWDRLVTVVNATNSTGTGITAAGILAQLDDTSPTTITENQFGNARISTDRSLLVAMRATTPTQTTVASSVTNVNILALNVSRKGATIYNDSSATLYLKLGTTASTTSYTLQLQGNGYYEVPFGYIGNIDGIWSSATGNARITEII